MREFTEISFNIAIYEEVNDILEKLNTISPGTATITKHLRVSMNGLENHIHYHTLVVEVKINYSAINIQSVMFNVDTGEITLETDGNPIEYETLEILTAFSNIIN